MIDPITVLSLWTGVDHADPYIWSAVLLAHALLGLLLTGLVAAWLDWMDTDDFIDGRPGLAGAIVVLGYFTAWEGGAQGFSEGIVGSLTDTAAITAGAVIGLTAWARRGPALAVAAVLLAVLWGWGIWGRVG